MIKYLLYFSFSKTSLLQNVRLATARQLAAWFLSYGQDAVPGEGSVITEQNSLQKGRSGGIYQTTSERYVPVLTILLVFKKRGITWFVQTSV